MSALIELKNVERSYPLAGGRSWVLRNINLSIDEGEFVSIMGPSGSGKTSLLNVLGLMDAEFEGEYRLAGNEVHRLNGKQRQALQREAIGFIFQHYHLLDDLTVAENLDLPLSYRDIRAPERKALVGDILDRFQIVGKKDLYPRQLSGGQQQLVAVARAVITRPKLLLADEPTGALHSTQGQMIMELLAELNREGATIVQVTHSPQNATYGNRTVHLQDGWLTEAA
ncbi:ABC transporter ATP-binding protein [Pseudofulvimonas gallinarii]|uniref:ABC-type lipoprotein export system ATPase subunit n=1 Tax=Pseudofulvimonas gallinarii TaxID=634155 RepID=A0A4R3LNX5_9GAMM|nr:ABC transporter ATP-binding protein [Pseudofulvimonas gallinarii]TCS99686.1 ABC-type lipoprotein export system ATPase subunit [Pseudofulvimonas gallinarii]THD15277.1 phosphonate ABC transporter ATP-binding protein [Pseudofulvimonas gallinarii]